MIQLQSLAAAVITKLTFVLAVTLLNKVSNKAVAKKARFFAAV